MAVLKMKEMEVGQLRPYENNPRRNDKAVDAVKNSVKKFGYVNPIIVNEDGVILAGHTRLKALNALGIDKVDCVVVSDLTEEEQKAFRIADNRAAELSEWDPDLLVAEMRGVGADDWEAFGFKAKDLKKLEPPEVCTCPKCGAKFFRS